MFFKVIFLLTLLIFSPTFVVADTNSSEIDLETIEEFEEEFSEDFGDAFDEEFSEDFVQEPVEDFDPLSGYNRMMTGFNDSLYSYVVFPLGRGYRYVTPDQFRDSVDNFFTNLQYPVRLVNNLLQLKFMNSVEESGRFLINSTIGVAGLFDPATHWFELDAHNEDFGQTLGHYGVGGGFHLVLPFFGPSNLRDTLSLYVDWWVDPFFYQEGRSYNLIAQNVWQSIGLMSFKYFNEYSDSIEGYEALKKDAIDLYPMLKSVYRQNRAREIEE